jgi:hypothetical protein
MSAGMRTKLLFKAGFAPVQHLHARKHETAAGDQSDPSCPFCTCSDETAAHFALECPQFCSRIPAHAPATVAEYRTAMREALGEQVGEHAFAEWDALQADEKLAALLNDHRWGKAATGVDYIAQQLPVRYSAGKGGPPSNHPLHTSRRHCRCEGPWQSLLRLVHQALFIYYLCCTVQWPGSVGSGVVDSRRRALHRFATI